VGIQRIMGHELFRNLFGESRIKTTIDIDRHQFLMFAWRWLSRDKELIPGHDLITAEPFAYLHHRLDPTD
jgi:hypothetical protein